jgi:putative SOS response-associated peptidase YedK
VDGFYECKKVVGGKIPYSISMKDDSPFVFAGLWSKKIQNAVNESNDQGSSKDILGRLMSGNESPCPCISEPRAFRSV